MKNWQDFGSDELFYLDVSSKISTLEVNQISLKHCSCLKMSELCHVAGLDLIFGQMNSEHLMVEPLSHVEPSPVVTNHLPRSPVPPLSSVVL